MTFSVVVVCLNAGDKLKETIDSVLMQTYDDYEIVIKDGLSSDGSLSILEKEPYLENRHIRLFEEKDEGIYDAMNQAVAHTLGDYLVFLNCGDSFFNENVLKNAALYLQTDSEGVPRICYGDTYNLKNHVCVNSAPVINGFTCFRHLPCHQSFFYARELCVKKPYDTRYRIRADYDHLLWCFFKEKVPMRYMHFTVSKYEGGGYSETKENEKRSKNEHKEIVRKYIPAKELTKYRLIMALTLAPVRSFLAEKTPLSGVYNKIRSSFYTRQPQN